LFTGSRPISIHAKHGTFRAHLFLSAGKNGFFSAPPDPSMRRMFFPAQPAGGIYENRARFRKKKFGASRFLKARFIL
jgi:hypothetical protein